QYLYQCDACVRYKNGQLVHPHSDRVTAEVKCRGSVDLGEAVGAPRKRDSYWSNSEGIDSVPTTAAPSRQNIALVSFRVLNFKVPSVQQVVKFCPAGWTGPTHKEISELSIDFVDLCAHVN